MTDWLQKHKNPVLLSCIMLLAAFLRFYKLDVLPPGLHPDEAANGLDIFRILEQHDFRPFYSANGGREALFFYLQAVGVTIFDNTILGLRVAPALIGTLGVGAVYLWVSSWFDRRAGLIAASLMAVTPWALTISRDGFRASMLMLMIPLTLWLFTKAFQTKQHLWFGLAGFSLGLGFYTYIAFRLFPVALVAVALYVLIWRRTWLAQWIKPLAVSALVTVITLVPLGMYALAHPDDIAGRPGGVSVFNKDLNHGDLVGTLAGTTIKTLGMFNVHGDENYRHNLGGQPEFNIFVGTMFLLGIFASLTKLRKLNYFALLVVFAAMLLPVILTAEGIPHALRGIGALAPSVALAAIGISYMLSYWYKVFPLNSAARTGGTVGVGVLLALTVYQGYTQYFVAWASAPQTYEAYSEDVVALANYYNLETFDGRKYAVSSEYGMYPADFLTHGKSSYIRVDPSELATLPPDPSTPKRFTILESDKDKALKQLNQQFPQGRLSPHYSSVSGRELFVVYTVSAQ